MAGRREIDEALEWHETALLGFAKLEQLVLKHRVEASRRGERYFGLDPHEIQDEFEKVRGKHDIFALLALYATCEGGIRADACWRGEGSNGQRFNSKFKRTVDERFRGIVKLSTLLQRWRTSLPDPNFARRIDELQREFGIRNKIAHGCVDGVTEDFLATYVRLRTIRDKWISFVPDFQGF
ncbi:conserved protein of unknown function [Pararobbsia alpina]|uniref:hypothetical protein n=1 Tax=Pararobbsia alpina TaxID=621374 RepID=UPI0039A6074C